MRAQVERLEHDRPTPAPPAPVAPAMQPVHVQTVQTIVRVHAQALTPVEIKSLLDDVERGFHAQRQVLAALRGPGEILELVEGKGTLTIVTRTKSAACSTPDRAALLVRLSRYCPDAIARRGAV